MLKDVLCDKLLFTSYTSKKEVLFKVLSRHGTDITILEESDLYLQWEITDPHVDIYDVCNILNDLGCSGVWLCASRNDINNVLLQK